MEETKNPVDKIGRIIPDVCMDIWNRRPEVQELLTALSKVRVAISKAQETKDILYKRTSFSIIMAGLDRAYGSLKTAMPYAVCPVCQGHGSCRVCEDKGMVSQFMWDTAIDRETKADIDNLIKEQK